MLLFAREGLTLDRSMTSLLGRAVQESFGKEDGVLGPFGRIYRKRGGGGCHCFIVYPEKYAV